MLRRLIRFVVVLSVLLGPLAQTGTLAQNTPDGDHDGLPDGWETAYGLNPQSAAGVDGATGDPDGDGATNAAELAAGTHPRGFKTRRLAEGVDNAFFTWTLALANPDAVDAHVQVAALFTDGSVQRLPLILPARSRRTLVAADIEAREQSFSVDIVSDVAIGADRVMTWSGAGSHAETSVAQAAPRWYIAEGATGGDFNLFYLLQNAGDVAANVTVRYLRPAPTPPLDLQYVVAAHSRYSIWVDAIPELAADDVSAVITSTVPIAVERAMYYDNFATPFVAGNAASGVTAPALEWFLAEGATGPFFDEYILLANPSPQTAQIQIDYLLPDGTVIPKAYDVAGESRRTIWVDHEHPWLENAAVSTRLRSLNGVPFLAERTMWWADGGWYESHSSVAAAGTGTRWLVSAGEVGGPSNASTYVLIANPTAVAGQAKVTLLFEGGGTAEQTFPIVANSRFNVDVGTLFPEAAGRRFATLVESLGTDPAELVVEWSLYGTPGGRPWELGANALAMNLSGPLRSLPNLPLVRGAGIVTIESARARSGSEVPVYIVASSAPGTVAATIDGATGTLRLTPGTATGSATITVTARVSGQPDVVERFVATVVRGRAVQFAASVSLGSQLFPAFADMNGDGRLDLVGTLNDGTRLVPQDLRAIGLGAIVDHFAASENRENHPVDVNGDGRLDIVTWAYLPITDPRSLARLFIAQPDGTYVEDAAFSALGIKGYGHNIASADFDNDGDVDLFMIDYTHNDPREQCFLLLNDGQGRFTEVADLAGVATRGWPLEWKTEGTQAVDVDLDGDLDLYVASHFYFNEGVVDGVPRFVDRRAALGLPLRFDEGLKFLDFDNDGRLDLLMQHPSEGPQLWRNTGAGFVLSPLPANVYARSYGATACDLNGDGFEDLLFAPGDTTRTRLLLNVGGGVFLENPASTIDGTGGDTLACGDVDGDGRLDVGRRGATGLEYLRNTTSHGSLNRLVIEVVGDQGEHNQYGRVVRIVPAAAPATTYTRVVDGGSGFLSMGQYPLLVGTPYSGAFTVSVRFDNGTVTFTMNAGERRRVYRTGVVEPLP